MGENSKISWQTLICSACKDNYGFLIACSHLFLRLLSYFLFSGIFSLCLTLLPCWYLFQILIWRQNASSLVSFLTHVRTQWFWEEIFYLEVKIFSLWQTAVFKKKPQTTQTKTKQPKKKKKKLFEWHKKSQQRSVKQSAGWSWKALDFWERLSYNDRMDCLLFWHMKVISNFFLESSKNILFFIRMVWTLILKSILQLWDWGLYQWIPFLLDKRLIESFLWER